MVQAFQLAVDAQVVVALLREIYAGVEDGRLARHACFFRECEFFGEELIKPRHHVIVADVRVRDFRLADCVHDEQRSACVGTNARILVVGQRADVVEDVTAARQHAPRDAGPPCVDGKQSRIVPAFDETQQLRRFLLLGDWAAIGARAFGPDVHDVRAVGDKLPRFHHRCFDVRDAVAGERIRDQIHNAHDERTAWKSDRVAASEEFHGSGTVERLRRVKRSVSV